MGIRLSLQLCEEGEERYGFLGTRWYSATSRVRKRFYDFIAKDISSSFKPKKVLDIGCGLGDVLILLADLNPGAELFGIDPSPQMLKLANDRIMASLPNGSGSNVHLGQGSSRLIPFTGGFDLIITSLSFHHWNNREQCIPPILERLNDGGTFAIYEYNKDSSPFLFKLLQGKHMVSGSEIERLKVDGYEKSVLCGGPFLSLRFRKTRPAR